MCILLKTLVTGEQNGVGGWKGQNSSRCRREWWREEGNVGGVKILERKHNFSLSRSTVGQLGALKLFAFPF